MKGISPGTMSMPALFAATLAALALAGCAYFAKAPSSLRLYVLDCGTLHIGDPQRFNLKREEVASTDLSLACVLVAHPKGTLMWDTGGVPDADWGEAIVAVVSVTAGAAADAADVISAARSRLAAFKSPKHVVFVDAIVRSPAGKADYRWARDFARQHLGR